MDIKSQGAIIDSLNGVLSFFQQKSSQIYEKSIILKNLDNIIYCIMLLLIVASMFCQSEILGIIALAILFLTVLKLFVKSGERFEMNTFEKFLLAYFMVVIISLAGSTIFSLSLKGFFKTFTYMGFYLSAVQFYRKNPNKIPYTIALIAICAGFQGIIGFIQNFAHVSAISTWQDVSRINPEEVMTRVLGTLKPLNPNLYGGYMISVLPAAVAACLHFFNDKKYTTAIIFAAISVISALSVVLSGCRGAYVGLFVILLLITILIGKFIWEINSEKLKHIYRLSIGTISACAASAIILITPIRARVLSMFVMRADSSTSFRFNVYQSSIQMIKDNWLFGIGLGNNNFREIYGLYMRTGFDALSTYSVYLEHFVESGIFALVFFLLFLFYLAKYALGIILDRQDQKHRIIAACALISVAAVMTHGFFDTVFFRPQIQFIFWTMTAFISALPMQEKN